MYNNTLYLASDYEAQKLSLLRPADIEATVRKHFLYSVLLSNIVVMPAGCYYQSAYTQRITNIYKDLFLPYKHNSPVVEYAIGFDRDSFYEDARIKSNWYPKKNDYLVYQDEDSIKFLSEQINDIKPSKRSNKMRNVLTKRISYDISDNGLSKQELIKFVNSEILANEIIKPLKIVIEEQKYAILPEYIEMEMEKYYHLLNIRPYKQWLDFILFKGYADSCKDSYGSYSNNPLSLSYNRIFHKLYPYVLDYRDTLLFQTFVEMFPFNDILNIEQKTSQQILEMKKSYYVKSYIACYKRLIKEIETVFKTIVLGNNPYDELTTILDGIRRKQFTEYKEQIVQNIEQALLLYKVLKRYVIARRRTKAFQQWISNQDVEMIPSVQLLSYIDNKNDLLNLYCNELFLLTKNIKKERDRKMKKNVQIAFGLGSITQKFNSDNSLSINAVSKDDFNNISWNELEKFIGLLDGNDELKQAKEIIITLLSSGKYGNINSYMKNKAIWEEYLNKISVATRNTLQVLADSTSIATFIMKLLGLNG